MKAIGIDHGKKRVGVAVSDLNGRLALPLEVVSGKDRHKLLTRLFELVEDHAIDTVVVGHPLTLDGSVGPQARQAEEFSTRLQSRLGHGATVVLWDERMTSVQVDRVRPDGSKVRADGTRDLMAAVLILQNYLDAQQIHRS